MFHEREFLHVRLGFRLLRPLGLVVVGGLLFSQLVTLYLTPVFYTYMANAADWFGHRKKGKAAKAAALAPVA